MSARSPSLKRVGRPSPARRRSVSRLTNGAWKPLRAPEASAVSLACRFSSGPDAILAAAPAKLNLFLEVLGKRPDGYHDIESLLLTINLFDTLLLRSTTDGQIRLSIDALPPQGERTYGQAQVPLSTGPDNLVCRAADALRQAVNRPELGASITLTKRIPMQAGLGGGSSDAAATLSALNHLWKLHLPWKELQAIATSLGSDVPFFLGGPAAWCRGRGELVEPAALAQRLHFVVACPPVGLATAEVYRHLVVPSLAVKGDAARHALHSGRLDALGRALHNRLQEPALRLAPTVAELLRALTRLRPLGCLMSGSGSACFALCSDRADAQRLTRDLAHACSQDRALASTHLYIVSSLGPEDYR